MKKLSFLAPIQIGNLKNAEIKILRKLLMLASSHHKEPEERRDAATLDDNSDSQQLVAVIDNSDKSPDAQAQIIHRDDNDGNGSDSTDHNSSSSSSSSDGSGHVLVGTKERMPEMNSLFFGHILCQSGLQIWMKLDVLPRINGKYSIQKTRRSGSAKSVIRLRIGKHLHG